jgi:hypothetical protein
MKKQIIERIARELLNEARRFRAIVRTAQPNIRSEAKANNAELAFEVEFKVGVGLSKLPAEAEIMDEVAKSIGENTTVGLSSDYANGNYYYILSPIKTDKTRVYLYNVYIFKKRYVWKGYKEEELDANGYADKRGKILPGIPVSSIPGAIYIGKSILYNSATWPEASQLQLKMYQPHPKAFAFINKVVNNQVDIVPAIDDKKVGEPKKSATSTDNKTVTADPNVVDAAKAATDTIVTPNLIKQTSQPSQKVPPRETSPVTTSIKSNTAVIIKSASPMFVYKDGKFTSINKQTQLDQQGTLIKLDASKNYAEVKLKNPPIDMLPVGYDQLKFKTPGKKLTISTEDDIKSASFITNKENYIYRGYDKAARRTLIEPSPAGSSIPFWVVTSELTMPPSKTIWIRKKDIK